MRILYVTREAPFFPSGGIGTYIGYMAEAMQAAGHEVFFLGWSEDAAEPLPADTRPFPPGHVHIHRYSARDAWRRTPVTGEDLVRTADLARVIARQVRDWRIDVVEASDFQAPALAFFEDVQTRSGNEAVLCVSYNHGFIEDFYEADQMRVPDSARINNLCERQQCRIADLVIAPSECARRRIAGYGIADNVAVVREPYVFEKAVPLVRVAADLTHFGRIALSKGVDKTIHLANALHPVFPLQTLRFVGRIVRTPFREADMQKYIRARLDPDLLDNVLFTGFLPREKALRWLAPGSIAPSLGSAETFSFACVETIDRGLLPVVRAGTPMAEFFPDDVAHHVLPETLGSTRAIQRHMEALIAEAPAVVARVQDHCRETLDPARIAGTMADLYEARLALKRGRRAAAVRRPLTLADVTVLIPAYRPTAEFAETVDSLVAQTAGIPRVIICDDGTPEDKAHWFAYAEAQLPDCRIIRQPNGRLLAARMTLLEACETEAALFLDTDDLLRPQALARMIEAWNSAPEPVDAVIPQRQNFGESSETILRNLLEDHLHLIANDLRMTALIRTEVLREIGFDPTRRNGEGDDWVFWLAFTGTGRKARVIPGLDFLYRFREGSMSWPWSQGQHVGTHSMIRETAIALAEQNPRFARHMARALYVLGTKA